MKVLLVAPPGGGKGTQGAVIADHFGVPHIATGDLLRDHVARRTTVGVTVEKLLGRGQLVPDEVVLDMVRDALERARDAGTGYVLDGIPRTIEQALELYRLAKAIAMTADVALNLAVGDEEVTRRLLARAAVAGRTDDTAEVIAKRLTLYHDVTAPVLAWYAERGILITVDSARPVAEVSREILAALEVVRSQRSQPEVGTSAR